MKINFDEDMQVKCINIYNEFKKQYEVHHHSLTIGKKYIVLEVEIYLNKVLYRLIGDNTDQAPNLYNASQFKIVSGKTPSNWEISHLENNTLILGPAPWQLLGFWEDCFDGDPAALEIYKREARIVMEEENML